MHSASFQDSTVQEVKSTGSGKALTIRVFRYMIASACFRTAAAHPVISSPSKCLVRLSGRVDSLSLPLAGCEERGAIDDEGVIYDVTPLLRERLGVRGAWEPFSLVS